MHLRWKSKRIQGFAYIEGSNTQVQTGYAKFHNATKPYYRISGWSFIAMTFDGQYLKLYIMPLSVNVILYNLLQR